jgi:hypothetical protein
MKPVGQTISVITNTNRIVGCSESDWTPIRPGSYIRVENEGIFYEIAKIRPFFYIKDFTVVGPTQIAIRENTSINLIPGDVLDISYKEYGMTAVVDLLNGGSGYKEGDELFIGSGKVSFDSNVGMGLNTTFTVQEVNGNGTITRFGLKESGKYIEPPTAISNLEGGSGTGAVIHLQYDLLDNRAIIERAVSHIVFEENITYVHFNYVFPKNLTQGKFSVNKWEMFLTGNYIGPSRFDVTYDIARDFTPHAKLPLLVKNSLTVDVVVNKAFTLIDNKIQSVDERLKALEEVIKTSF